MKKKRPEAWQGRSMDLARIAAEAFGAPLGLVTGTARAPSAYAARHVVRWVLHVRLGLSTVDTGAATGSDHSSVIHSVARVYNTPALLRAANEIAARPIAATDSDETERRETLFAKNVARWRELCGLKAA